MERIDSPDGRSYKVTVDGVELAVPSVTTVLHVIDKSFLKAWAVKLAAEHLLKVVPLDMQMSRQDFEAAVQEAKKQHVNVLTYAGDFGTQTHDLFEAHLLGEEPDLSEKPEMVRRCVERFIEWWNGSGFSLVATEMRLYSPTHLYAGTMDCLAMDANGKLYLLDWKTSNQYNVEYALQTVAYKMAYQELYGGEITDIYVVRVGKEDAELQVVHIPEASHAYLFEQFLHVRAVWQFTKDYTHGVMPRKRKYTPKPKAQKTEKTETPAETSNLDNLAPPPEPQKKERASRSRKATPPNPFSSAPAPADAEAPKHSRFGAWCPN